MGLLLIASVVILAPDFTTSPPAAPLLLSSYAATWLLSAATAASLPISYSPYIGDYTRYISPKRWTQKQVMLASGVGMFGGCAVALCFAIYVAMAFPADTTDWVAGFVGVAPTVGAVPIVIIALLGSCAQGALCVYGTGLDTSSIIPALKRVPATVLIGLLGTVTVFIGSFAYNLVSAAAAFLIILLVVTAPWVVINIIGYMLSRGRYYAHDLQVFNMNPRVRGGAYWFQGGWNAAAMLAWVPATLIGLLFVNTTLFVGPWANAFGGIDVSFISAAVIGGVLYLVLAKLIPGSVVVPAAVSEEEDAARLVALVGAQQRRDGLHAAPVSPASAESIS
jgi:purine-cytosine permease-like protein